MRTPTLSSSASGGRTESRNRLRPHRDGPSAGRTLVLQGHDGGTWTFHLDPVDEETTRFIVRGRSPESRTAVGYVMRYLAYELPHFVMERGMMRGIQARTER